MNIAPDVFTCRRCGHCCQGEGGIILTAKDIARLAGHLALAEAEFLARHAEERHGRQRVAMDASGYCVFYDAAIAGCGVHPARPDICRAWPFFRGNLLDEDSWRMSQDYCPGIELEAGHRAFARQGRDYVAATGLASTSPDAPQALRPVEDAEESA